MGITTDQIDGITDGDVVSTNGDKIGGIGQIYLDDNTGEPNWVTAKTGLFGTSESFVPLDGAELRGGDIVVKYDKATVKDAPRVDADGSISPEEEDALYSYYGLSGTAGYDTDRDDAVTGTTTDRDYATTGTTTDRDYATTGTTDTDYATAGTTDTDDRTRGTKGYDVSGPETDDAMTLSEERVEVGTQTREAGRARLRKYVVTENVTKTVPVQREEVRLEREPITEANRGAAESGPEISEEEHEVVLHEERPVVEKEAVPVERVRLDTETVTDDVTVSEEVRKEQLDTDIDEDLPRR
ncbi:MAG TPA: PRC and DUF2382 domain-containing protein [Propionibacteriaceae bacterium]|nr:PRC and DUF2382 domain-containing protein [Propionibacteriaceae bacterium]